MRKSYVSGKGVLVSILNELRCFGWREQLS